MLRFLIAAFGSFHDKLAPLPVTLRYALFDRRFLENPLPFRVTKR